MCIPVAIENALTCYDREGYNKILEKAKRRGDPDGRYQSAFEVRLRLNPELMEEYNFMGLKDLSRECMVQLQIPSRTFHQ